MVKRIFLPSFFVLIFSLAYSQSTNVSTLVHGNVKKADQFFDHLAFRNALAIYLHIVDKNGGNIHVRQRIAECYLNIHDPESAEFWFESIAKEPNLPESFKFEYAEVLAQNGKYEEAIRWYKDHLKIVPKDTLSRNKLEFLENINYYKRDSMLYQIAPVSINSEHQDFGADDFQKGLVFVSARDKELFVKRKSLAARHEDEALYNLFYTERLVTGEFTEPKLLHIENFNSQFHDGPAHFYDNHKKAVYTQSNIHQGNEIRDYFNKVHLKLYFGDVQGDGLVNINPFPYNSDGYSVAHACVTNDGKTMYFASNMPKGYGGIDIYSSSHVNGQWSEPENLGPMINTPGDEMYPFIVSDNTLYFTSNGHGGMGGLDLFVSNLKKGRFTKAINLGFPMNTAYDDFAMSVDSTGHTGYMSSNRPGGMGSDDVYYFVSSYYFLVGRTLQLGTNEVVPNTMIYVYDENGNLVDSTRSDDEGFFHLDLPLGKDYSISAKKEGFDTLDEVDLTTKGKNFTVDSLLLPLWKHELFAKGRVFNNETQQILPGATVTLQNMSDNAIDTVVVNEKGEYVFKVFPNKEYKIKGEKEGFIPSGFDLNTKDILKGDLLNDIVLEAIHIDRDTIYFEFDKYEVLPEFGKTLDKLIATLKANPKATLSIRAHADSRGSFTYNQGLTNRRANATVQYFVKKGIKASRISAKGFGEKLLLNQCSDGVECPEEQHSRNRRAEIKVQKD